MVDRADFPLLERLIEGRPIIYLDNAATTLKPRTVVDAVVRYLSCGTANIHRGKHLLSQEASELCEEARRKVSRFLGVVPRELIFTPSATHAINMVAAGLEWPGNSNVVTTLQEHHSNLLPYFGRAELRFAPVDAHGALVPEALLSLIDEKTRLVALSHASNVTGAILPLAAIIQGAKARDVPVLVDGTQAVPHFPVNVAALDCDYYVFSGHKTLGPPGVGVLTGRAQALERLGAPVRGGGVVRSVGQGGYELKPLPYRLEPGTPDISAIIGLGAAIDYLEAIDAHARLEHERALAQHLARRLASIPGVKLLGPRPGDERLALASISFDNPHLTADNIALVLSDSFKIMVRSGHHCCHPFFDSLGIPGALRASAYLYNTIDEIDIFCDALASVLRKVDVPRGAKA